MPNRTTLNRIHDKASFRELYEPTARRCHFAGCHNKVAFKVTEHQDDGLRQDRVFYSCRVKEHQLGNMKPDWKEPTETTVHKWELFGHTGTMTVEPLKY
jgi:hypothetical protein